MKDLKQKTIRGGVAKIVAQGANFVIRIGSLVILARLLDPKDFGLVGMVTAFTGVLNLFRDFGLSSAAVQRGTVTDEQASTLFWINLLVGALLALLTIAAAPMMALFYAEPRLLAVTLALSTAFVFNAAGVQHSVRLQRELRFIALAAVNTASLLLSSALAVGSAIAGIGYWALVVMTIAMPLLNTIGCWSATKWLPGPPRRGVGLRSLARFGGTVTLNGLLYYAAGNLDKVLLGRRWGSEVLGLYGRAFQLINIPSDNLNQAAGEVAFSALSRLQAEPTRLKAYFLKGYSLLLTVTLPITVACGLFADDIVAVLLGPKWTAAAPIFRLLAPAMLAYAVVNPLGWLLTSLGLVGRGLKMALVMAPLMIVAYALGLSHGAAGVASAYSIALMVWIIPAMAWALHRTPVGLSDVIRALSRPLAASLVAGVCGLGVGVLGGRTFSPLVRLVMESSVLLVVFVGILFFALGQMRFYLDVIRPPRPTLPEPEPRRVA